MKEFHKIPVFFERRLPLAGLTVGIIDLPPTFASLTRTLWSSTTGERRLSLRSHFQFSDGPDILHLFTQLGELL